MKKYFLIVAIIFALFGLRYAELYAQKSKKEPGKTGSKNIELYAIQEQIFKTGLKYGDLDVARQALYEMIVLDPENTYLTDTLAFLYFNSNLFPQSILVCNDILKKAPGNTNILEIKAISEQSIGLFKEALADYEKLNSLGFNVLYLYQIDFLQYRLKRYGECKLSLDALFAYPDTDKQKINITMNDGSRQVVPLKAAVWNIKGVMFMDMNENDKAKNCFIEALKIFPDFMLVKGNMEFVEKKMTGKF